MEKSGMAVITDQYHPDLCGLMAHPPVGLELVVLDQSSQQLCSELAPVVTHHLVTVTMGLVRGAAGHYSTQHCTYSLACMTLP